MSFFKFGKNTFRFDIADSSERDVVLRLADTRPASHPIKPNSIVVKAYLNRPLEGFAEFTVAEGVATLEYLFVSPEARVKGLASFLLLACIIPSQALLPVVTSIKMQLPTNTGSLFFISRGFEATAQDPRALVINDLVQARVKLQTAIIENLLGDEHKDVVSQALMLHPCRLEVALGQFNIYEKVSMLETWFRTGNLPNYFKHTLPGPNKQPVPISPTAIVALPFDSDARTLAQRRAAYEAVGLDAKSFQALLVNQVTDERLDILSAAYLRSRRVITEALYRPAFGCYFLLCFAGANFLSAFIGTAYLRLWLSDGRYVDRQNAIQQLAAIEVYQAGPGGVVSCLPENCAIEWRTVAYLSHFIQTTELRVGMLCLWVMSAMIGLGLDIAFSPLEIQSLKSAARSLLVSVLGMLAMIKFYSVFGYAFLRTAFAEQTAWRSYQYQQLLAERSVDVPSYFDLLSITSANGNLPIPEECSYLLLMALAVLILLCATNFRAIPGNEQRRHFHILSPDAFFNEQAKVKAALIGHEPELQDQGSSAAAANSKGLRGT